MGTRSTGTGRGRGAGKRPVAKRLVRACDEIVWTVAHPEVLPFPRLAHFACLNRAPPELKHVSKFSKWSQSMKHFCFLQITRKTTSMVISNFCLYRQESFKRFYGLVTVVVRQQTVSSWRLTKLLFLFLKNVQENFLKVSSKQQPAAQPHDWPRSDLSPQVSRKY